MPTKDLWLAPFFQTALCIMKLIKQATLALLPEISSHFCPVLWCPLGPLNQSGLATVTGRGRPVPSSPQSSDGTIPTPTKFRRKGSAAGWLVQVAKGHQTCEKKNGRPCLVHCRKGARIGEGPNGWLVVCHSPGLAHTFTQLWMLSPTHPHMCLAFSFSSMWTWASA